MGELLDRVHDAVSRIHILKKKKKFIWLSQVLAAAHMEALVGACGI